MNRTCTVDIAATFLQLEVQSPFPFHLFEEQEFNFLWLRMLTLSLLLTAIPCVGLPSPSCPASDREELCVTSDGWIILRLPRPLVVEES